jgi:hypothetical protein
MEIAKEMDRLKVADAFEFGGELTAKIVVDDEDDEEA